jgi:hypothetical protein
MENEYARFGLPDDPAHPPDQAIIVQRGWFARNFWWLLPAVLLALVLPCGCCGGIFWWLVSSLKSSEPYQVAVERVRANPQVIQQLGEPVEVTSWMPSGNFSYNVDNGAGSGKADFHFTVAGPKGAAHVHAAAVCRNSKWRFRVLDVTPVSTGKTISLPVDGKATKAEEE